MGNFVRLTHRPIAFVPPNNHRIAASVDAIERGAFRAPTAAVVVVAGAWLLMPMAAAGGRAWPGVGMLAAFGVILLFGASACRLAIHVIARRAYRRIAATLEHQMHTLSGETELSLAWSMPTPGAIAITQAGKLVLVTRATGYDQLWMTGADLVDVRMRYRGGWLPLRQPMAADTPREGTSAPVDIFIAYRLVRNGRVSVVSIPCSDVPHDTERLYAAIVGLRST